MWLLHHHQIVAEEEPDAQYGTKCFTLLTVKDANQYTDMKSIV